MRQCPGKKSIFTTSKQHCLLQRQLKSIVLKVVLQQITWHQIIIFDFFFIPVEALWAIYSRWLVTVVALSHEIAFEILCQITDWVKTGSSHLKMQRHASKLQLTFNENWLYAMASNCEVFVCFFSSRPPPLSLFHSASTSFTRIHISRHFVGCIFRIPSHEYMSNAVSLLLSRHGNEEKNRTVCISLNAIIFVVSHISKAVVDW